MKRYLPEISTTLLFCLVLASGLFDFLPFFRVVCFLFALAGGIFAMICLVKSGLKLIEKLDLSYYASIALAGSLFLCVLYFIKEAAQYIS